MSLQNKLASFIVVGTLALTSACSASSGSTAASSGSTSASSGSTAASSAESPAKIVLTDDFDREVEVPTTPEKIAVLEWEGLVAKTLAILGEDDTIVAVDPATKDDPTRKVIVEGINNAVEVGSAWSGINYEKLASVTPEVVFLEAWVASDEDRKLHQDAVAAIEKLGIPVVVFLSPSNFEKPDMASAYSVIDMVGTVYNRTADTDKVVDEMRIGIDEVLSRLPKDGPAPTVAVFATVSYLMGEKSIQNSLFASLLGANNVAGPGTFVPISEEQLLAKDPDVLVLIGHEGYVSTDQVKDGKDIGLDWGKVRDLRAIRESRMTALGYDEWRATIETPMAMLKVAKVLYPAQFADVDIAERELAFYQDVFDLDTQEAAAAIEGQKFRADLGN